MADPIVAPVTGATLAAGLVAAPVLSLFGIPLGLHAPVLIASLAGAIAAIVLLDTVPGSTDTLPELLRTTGRRITVALVSSVAAGYGAPVIGPMFQRMLDVTGGDQAMAVLLLTAFVMGAGVKQFLQMGLNFMARRGERAAEGA